MGELTKLELVAAMAMQGILANPETMEALIKVEVAGGTTTSYNVSTLACLHAKSLLAVLEEL